MTSDPLVPRPQDAHKNPIFASITAGPYHTPDSIIRTLGETDIPIYYYACPNTLAGDCFKKNCNYCVLALRGYLVVKGGNREFVELPDTPSPVYGWKCSEHNEEICDDCDVFLEGNTRFRACEWDSKEKKFRSVYIDHPNPLLHGHFNRSVEKKQTRDRRERAAKRNSTRKPYDAENARARKSLRTITC